MRQLPALLLLVTLTVPLQAQTPTPPSRTPTFGVEIEVINLTVSVTDSRSRYVTDLKNVDFAVFEDGIRQDLSIFRHEDIPISMALVLDTSASMDEKMSTAQTAAARFVKTLRPQDNAQVMQFNDRTTVAPGVHRGPRAARGSHQADRGVGPDRAPQRALRGAQGPEQA